MLQIRQHALRTKAAGAMECRQLYGIYSPRSYVRSRPVSRRSRCTSQNRRSLITFRPSAPVQERSAVSHGSWPPRLEYASHDLPGIYRAGAGSRLSGHEFSGRSIHHQASIQASQSDRRARASIMVHGAFFAALRRTIQQEIRTRIARMRGWTQPADAPTPGGRYTIACIGWMMVDGRKRTFAPPPAAEPVAPLRLMQAGEGSTGKLETPDIAAESF